MWRALLGSLALHVLLAMLLAPGARPPAPRAEDPPIAIELLEPPPSPPATGGVGGGASGDSKPAARVVTSHRARRAPLQIEVHIEAVGEGTGLGHGAGHGFGDGLGRGDAEGDVIAAPDLVAPPPPPPPPAPPVSRARPAKLVFPTREGAADELFAALVTVDEEGDVIGVRMVKTVPGSRGEIAAAAIWRFRYAPALDDAGKPVRSTFEQPFGLR